MFENRQDAGKKLGGKLAAYKDKKEVVIFGIARGGVIVAKEVASFLRDSLQVLVIKKIGSPYNPELAVGAVAPQNTVFWDYDSIIRANIPKKQIEGLLKKAELEQKRREDAFGLDYIGSLKDKTVILIDDGIATGITVMAAEEFLRKKGCKKIILATPIISSDVLKMLRDKFDTIVIVESSYNLQAVGQFYKNFQEITDQEVLSLL